jgi:hypothetical protein
MIGGEQQPQRNGCEQIQTNPEQGAHGIADESRAANSGDTHHAKMNEKRWPVAVLGRRDTAGHGWFWREQKNSQGGTLLPGRGSP